MNLNELIRRAKEHNVPADEVIRWYRSQPVNQIIIPRRKEIKFHKTIGDGHGYQADIIFFPFPRMNKGYVGLLTFINTTSRMAFVTAIKNRTTEELMGKIESLLLFLKDNNVVMKSVTTDNELYNNIKIAHLFEDNGVEQYVEVVGTHTKLGIINRFHRSLREMLNKRLVTYNSKRWVDYIDDVIHNYNNRVHRTLGKSPISMTKGDVKQLNHRLRRDNQESVRRLMEFKVGDRVRYLINKSIFGKGGKRYSKDVHTITSIGGYNIDLNNMYRSFKYWELLKV